MTFYFYDLETSGINARAHRIMQFAGQRTDEDFNPIGEPHNWVVRLTEEVLPDPDAVMITGITPQKTLEEGYSEAEFLELFNKEILQPDTIIAGFNTVRFDDEFMRATMWRNFYDPYEWQWQDGRSRWDLMDVVRMVRALRPDGIEWPFAPARRKDVSEHGKIVAPKNGDVDQNKLVPTNRLELITKLNDLGHDKAHDALSDVYATIAVAKLLRDKQPKIFNYLLGMRGKKQVMELVGGDDPQPFLYCSGRYGNDWLKTTAVAPLAATENGSLLVYDLRIDPEELAKLSDEELTKAAFSRNYETDLLPVKVLKPNACPAVAPLGVLDAATQARIKLTTATIEKHYGKLRSIKDFAQRISRLHDALQSERKAGYAAELDPDFRLYEGFIGDQDKTKSRAVRGAGENELADMNLEFSDERLEQLLPRYKARNFPRSLTASEREAWEEYRTKRILEGAPGQLSLQQFGSRLAEIAAQPKLTSNDQFLLEELQLYAQNVAPIVEE